MSGLIRNVVLMVADQWRADTLGFLGTPGVKTPNLDELAARSVTFANHWCQASPCGPSRRSLHTGTHISTHKQWTNNDVGERCHITMTQAIRNAGVTPYLVGYTDTPNAPLEEEVRGEQLYDPAFEMVRPFYWQLGFPEYRAFLAEQGYGDLDASMTGIYPTDGEPDADGLAPSRIAAEHSDVAWLTDAAVDVIEQAEAPFFLHLNWLRPHPPMAPVSPYHRLIYPADVSMPIHPSARKERYAAHDFFARASAGRALNEYLQRPVTTEELTKTDERHIRAAYYGHCAEVDAQVGRVLKTLERESLLDETLVIFMSDHGEALGDHGLYGRRGPFDSHFTVPCIVFDPRADATRNTRITSFTTNMDIMPTILESVGAPIPDSVQGQSLGELVRDPKASALRDHVCYAMDWTDHGTPPGATSDSFTRKRFYAVRNERYRFVRFSDLPAMLFDLQEDPHELTNLAYSPDLYKVRDELEKALDAQFLGGV